MASKKKSTQFHDYLMGSLKNPEEAVEYLNAALREKDLEFFLVALRDVAEAKGIGKIAEDAKLNRENLYRILSEKGNPRLESLYSILNALGLQLAIEPKKKVRQSYG